MLNIKSKIFAGLMVALFVFAGASFAFADTITLPATGVKKTSGATVIKNLQSFLNWALGSSVTPLVVDGKWGKKTTNAIKAYQTANGLAVDGSFGKKSSAKAMALQANGGNGNGNGNNNPPNGGGVVLTGPVSVMLASDNPGSRSVVTGTSSSEAGADLAHFTFSGSGTVTSVSLKRTGISSDDTLSSVYLYDGVTRLTDASSVSNGGVINFNDPNGLFTVNGTKTIYVKADIKNAAAAGASVGIQLTGYTAAGQTATTLSTPISGNLMTIVSVGTDIAAVSFGAITPAANTSLTPDKDIIVWQSTASVTTRDTWLSRFAIREVGSIGKADISNLRLMVDANVVGTVANVDANGYATFAPATPFKLTSGSHTFKVLADVTGGSSLAFTFSIRNRTDIGLVDSQYNVGFLTSTAIGSLAGNQQTVSTGYITVQKATDSPSSTLVLSGTDAVLGRFTATTYGENVKVDTLLVDATISTAGSPTLRNGRVLVDGQQVGSTTTIDPASTGTSFNINHTFTPGTTSIIEVRADVYNNATGGTAMAAGDTVKATLSLGVNNAQGMVSGDATLDVPNANVDGNTLTVGSGSIVLAKDQSYGNQSVVVPTTKTLLGEWTLNSGNTESLNLDTIQVNFTTADEFDNADLSNVYVMYGAKSTSSKSTIANTTTHTSVGNSWNISETMAPNTSMVFKVYGDIATGAVVTTTTPDTIIPSLLVSGTSASGTAVNTNSNSVLAGQTITAVNSGTLTLSLDANTPVAAQAVAGSTDATGALKVKIAGTNEDQYVKTVKVYVNTSANTAAIASLNLASSTTSSGTYATVGTDQTVVNDGTNPGYSTWTLSGSGRITIPKNGSVYLKVTPTYVSSGQATVSGLTPKLFLGDLTAEGTSTLSAGLASHVNTTGIIVQSNASATYASSGVTTSAAVTSTTATSITATTGSVFTPGDVICLGACTGVDAEVMTVLADNGSSLTVLRGVYGTTAATHLNTLVIWRLNNAGTTRGIIGNAMTVLNTKVNFALSASSPSGATSTGTGKIVFAFTASAANNATDPATNTATLTYVDITTTKSGTTTLGNLKLYPSEYDTNATYATTCGAVTASKWRCTMSTAGNTNQIDENNSRTYIARGDTAYAANGSIDISIAALGTSSLSTSLNTPTTNSVLWTDGTTSQNWVNQASSYLQSPSPLSSAVASGTADATAPTIASIVMHNGAVAGDIDNLDYVVITYSEPIDASTVNTSLVPGGQVTGLTSGTGTITVAQATSIATVSGITTFDTGASVAAAVSAPTNTVALDSTGKILTITWTAMTGGGTITTPNNGAGTQVATTVTDANGVASAAVATPASTGAF